MATESSPPPSRTVFAAVIHPDPVLRAEYRRIPVAPPPTKSKLELQGIWCSCTEQIYNVEASLASHHRSEVYFITSQVHDASCPLHIVNPWSAAAAEGKRQGAPLGPMVFARLNSKKRLINMTEDEFKALVDHCRDLKKQKAQREEAEEEDEEDELTLGEYPTEGDAAQSVNIAHRLMREPGPEPNALTRRHQRERKMTDQQIELRVRKCLRQQGLPEFMWRDPAVPALAKPVGQARGERRLRHNQQKKNRRRASKAM